MRVTPLLPGLVLVVGCANGTPDPAPPADAAPVEQASGGDAKASAHGDHRHTGPMHHRFENAEEWAKHFEAPERAEWQKPDEVVASLELDPAAVVADLGAGTGYFAVRLAGAVPQGKVFAVDIEPDMARYVTERAEKEGHGNLVAVQSKPDDPSLPEAVDVVFLCDVYHHIAERPAYFGRVRESMKPGGRLVIVDFDPAAPEDAPGPPAKHRIGVEQVQEELAEAGFELVRRDDDLLPFQYVVELKVK